MKRRILSVTLLLASILAIQWPGVLSAAAPAPRAEHRHVARIVAELMAQSHYSKQPLDDEIAQRARDAFLRQLDPAKIYFQQSDIDEIHKDIAELTETLRKGDPGVAGIPGELPYPNGPEAGRHRRSTASVRG